MGLQDEPKNGRESNDNKTEIVAKDIADVTMTSTSSTTKNPSHYQQQQKKAPLFAFWTRFTEGIFHHWIRAFVVGLSLKAAKYPFATVAGIALLSLTIAITGYLTNFVTEFDQRVFLLPSGSLPDLHNQWIEKEFGAVRVLHAILHANNNNNNNDEEDDSDFHFLEDNVLTASAMRQAMQVMETINNTQGFQEICNQQKQEQQNNKQQSTTANYFSCRTFSVTQFWNNQPAVLEDALGQYSTVADQDAYVRQTISITAFGDGIPVLHELFLGHYQNVTTSKTTFTIIDNNSTELELEQQDGWIINSSQALVFKIDIPDLGPSTELLEQRLMDALSELRQQFSNQNDVDPAVLQLEYFTLNAINTEFQQTMNRDLPLVLVLIVVMQTFTCFVFYRHNQKVHSHALLGVFAFVTIGFSLITGYGIMFLAGVPMSSVGIMIPFVVAGVALDDTFIITGVYFHHQREAYKANKGKNSSSISTLEIIEKTMNEVALSISMTTWTTLASFLLGSTCSIPAVRWLCYYAATTLGVDFIYQITLFVALLRLDDMRVQANRRDLFFWIVVKEEESEQQVDKLDKLSLKDNESEEVEEEPFKDKGSETNDATDESQHENAFKIGTATVEEKAEEEPLKDDATPRAASPALGKEVAAEKTTEDETDESPQDIQDDDESTEVPLPLHQQEDAQQIASPPPTTKTADVEDSRPDLDRNFIERFMVWYSGKILQPWVKSVLLVAFFAYFAGCVYSTTLLRQEFNVVDWVRPDSFLVSYMEAVEKYTSVQRFIGVYFRNVDQSDPFIQEQMTQYVQELAELPQIGEMPAFFWLQDFQQLSTNEQVKQLGINTDALTFNDQVGLALSFPAIQQIYGQDIVRDEDSGNITASRTFLFLRKKDIMDDVQNQIDMLLDQREVTNAQPINSPEKLRDGELSFFTFEDLYFFWELYAVTVDELILTTVSCVVAVCVITLLFIPHWSAVLFVTPLLIMLYFMLLGTMQFFGLTVHSITFFIIVMSIGLLVDFLMHVLLRYYETKAPTRQERVKETLETMGASIFLGGFTTWLGVIPLAFSSTNIFMTVFISFVTMVTLGLTVGLGLLPILLSLLGPMDDVQGNDTAGTDTAGTAKKVCEPSSTTEVTTFGVQTEVEC